MAPSHYIFSLAGLVDHVLLNELGSAWLAYCFDGCFFAHDIFYLKLLSGYTYLGLSMTTSWN